MNDDVREAIELIAYMCKDVSDVPKMYPEDKNESELRAIKKIANKLLCLAT
jgi:hypothetical protein